MPRIYIDLDNEEEQAIVNLLRQNFPSFGGGASNPTNPISQALEKQEPQFAAGVSIKDVVYFTITCLKHRNLLQ